MQRLKFRWSCGPVSLKKPRLAEYLYRTVTYKPGEARDGRNPNGPAESLFAVGSVVRVRKSCPGGPGRASRACPGPIAAFGQEPAHKPQVRSVKGVRAWPIPGAPCFPLTTPYVFLDRP